MQERYLIHNQFRHDINKFNEMDPHLYALSRLSHQYSPRWWQALNLQTPGIYILTGGRQVGKSTSCKLLIQDCLQQQNLAPEQIYYLPCDEIYTAKDLSATMRSILASMAGDNFLLIVDEITYVTDWHRVIKALADEGLFQQGICLLTGSDSLILKEAAMSFPGRRGQSAKTDFHLYPLNFAEYVDLVAADKQHNNQLLANLFKDYLVCGGYLRAINDVAATGKVQPATYQTYEQWIRGDFLKRNKNEDFLLSLLGTLLTIGVSQISYSKLVQKIGLMSKDTCIAYCNMLQRMDVLLDLQAFDQNKKQGFPRKDRKFHFFDPFITHTIHQWLQREGQATATPLESTLVEACVASHATRLGKSFYFKGQGEIDLIMLSEGHPHAIEIKWAEQIRPADFKMLKQFEHATILTKTPQSGHIEGIKSLPVYQFLYESMKT